jgi:hypothetical protein
MAGIFLMLFKKFTISPIDELSFLRNSFHFVYTLGKPMPTHPLRCQGFAVDNYGFALERLEAGALYAFTIQGLYFG